MELPSPRDFYAFIFVCFQVNRDDDGGLDCSGGQEKHEKDSGVGRTDESTKNDESSEQEMNETECASPGSLHGDSNLGSGGELRYSNDSFTSNEQEFGSNEIPTDECSKFREVLETKFNSQDEVLTCDGMQDRVDSHSSIDRELEALHREMENIQLECQSIVQNHAREEQRVRVQADISVPNTIIRNDTPVSKTPSGKKQIKSQNCDSYNLQSKEKSWRVSESDSGKSLDSKRGKCKKVEEKEKDSSSAYNTGESGHSCRSTPLTLELTPQSSVNNNHYESMMSLCGPERTRERYEERRNRERQRDSSNSSRERSSGGGSTKKEVVASETMYTNPAHLQHTIMLQQRMLKERLARQGQLNPLHIHSAYHDSTLGSEMSQIPEGVEVEWKVKRRADGTRYITRRPVRNRILKERETKLLEERCGMTTDDDTMSELKVGRYWSKEDRKRHLERARDQKRRREFMMRARMESLKEQAGEDGKKEPNIIELSQKRMQKKMKGKKFDDFVTVQEMMVHGGQTLATPGSKLLSVTTV